MRIKLTRADHRGAVLDVDLSVADAEQIARRLDCKLEPVEVPRRRASRSRRRTPEQDE